VTILTAAKKPLKIKQEEFANFTKSFCESRYEEVVKNNPNISSIETACFNMTYTLNLLDEVYKGEPLSMIFTNFTRKHDNKFVSVFNR